MSMDEEIEAWSGFGGEWYEEKQPCGHENRYLYIDPNEDHYCMWCLYEDAENEAEQNEKWSAVWKRAAKKWFRYAVDAKLLFPFLRDE